MTALPLGVLDPIRRFHQIPVETINEVLGQYDPEVPDGGYECRQGREGEDTDRIAAEAQIRALVCHPGFWRVAARMPNNAIYWPVWHHADGSTTPAHLPKGSPRPGAPVHYPDYLMLLAACIASTANHRTYRAALDYLTDPDNWARLVHLIDQYVPDDWTRLSELPARSTVKQDKRRTRLRLARATSGRRFHAVPMTATNHGRDRDRIYPVPASRPPKIWHFKHWAQRFYGKTKKGQPLPMHDPYFGLRQRLLTEFRASAVDQSQLMGLFEPGLQFFVKNPLRAQFVGTDGVVFSCRHSETTQWHGSGAGPMQGTKYGIFSTRISGEAHTRLILDFANITKDLKGSFNDESTYVLDRLPLLRALSKDGIKGVLVDSAIRGDAVTALQHQDLCVVNYPHAESNPDGGPGRRLNPSRREKSHLRTTITHTDAQGFPCAHPIFAVGGDFLELVVRPEHEDGDLLKRVTRQGYLRRGRPGRRREYLKIKITCPRGGEHLTHLMPLFHTDPTSSDPTYKWGEVSRVFAPGTPEFAYLYGQRNDTEARHADLKRRIAYMPKSVAGQELRLLGAALAINAVALQAHRRHHEHPNVLDDTA